MVKKIICSFFIVWYLLLANTTFAYTHADTLRGSNGRGRDWWDVTRYDLQLVFDTTNKSISGINQIFFRITKNPNDSLQLDLQEPMVVDSVILMATNDDPEDIHLPFIKEGNVWWVKHPFHKLHTDSLYGISVYYHGIPREAVNPPWNGGFSWKHDSTGKLWVAVSCQGLGASAWWPCKDAQWDEPDDGMVTRFYVPGYFAIGNGKPLYIDSSAINGKPPGISGWVVKNPINNYDVTFYIGDYVHWHDTLMGEKGMLDLDFYVLRYNEEKAKKQFAVVKQMLHCFEYWMGPYPFYEDGYKLVEAPYVGMEHQSAIAYGNGYKMGYLGADRSTSGYGMDFDYIIIHESGHEWFGNNITAKDIADNWIHEGITTYSESLFAECLLGKGKGQKYCRGEWHNIRNDKPIIGDYGVNNEGSEDMYDKGAAIMHMIREMTNDDEKFRMMLRGLGKEFYHQTVTTQQMEGYINDHTGLSLKPFFNQYLRTTNIPQLEYYIKNGELNYKFNNTVQDFTLPITVASGETKATINPTATWQHIKWNAGFNVKFSNDFLIKIKE
jgi:aminopeptidase N